MATGTAPTAAMNGERVHLGLDTGDKLPDDAGDGREGECPEDRHQVPLQQDPGVVATPPPPLNWKKTGQLCPTMTAMNEAIRTHEGRTWSAGQARAHNLHDVEQPDSEAIAP